MISRSSSAGSFTLDTRYGKSKRFADLKLSTCAVWSITGLCGFLLIWRLVSPHCNCPKNIPVPAPAAPLPGTITGGFRILDPGEPVDPHVVKKFGPEICNRKRYPPTQALQADSVTILINGYAEARIPLLQETLQIYAESPLVDAIYVLWGNVSSPFSVVEGDLGWWDDGSSGEGAAAAAAGAIAQAEEIATREKADGIPGGNRGLGGGIRVGGPESKIHIVRQLSDSLNDRFLPRKFIRTRAVIICDDDITIDDKTLEFALRVWGENEQRLVGFFPRAHVYSLEEKGWVYTKREDRYSIVLTKLFILHADYLFRYTCHTPEGVKEYVDSGKNCEDIAMNFVVSQRAKVGPLLVDGKPRDWGDTRNSEKELSDVGLSARAGHKKDRGGCIGAFQRLWGAMELRYSYSKATPDVKEMVFCDKFGYMIHCDDRARTRMQAARAAGLHRVVVEQRYAYATLVASADLLPAALAHAQSLRLTGTAHDLVLMVDENAHDVNLKDRLLLLHFDHVRRVPTVTNPYGVKGFSKLNAWLMTEYDKVVYIDVDTLVLANLDHLFDRPEPTAVPDVYMSSKFNSGLLVLKPSHSTYSDMMSKMHRLPSYNKGDQGFLNAYFSGWFHMPPAHRLAARYNAVIFFPDHYHPPPWFRVEAAHEALNGPIMMVHFANPWFKPWRLGSHEGGVVGIHGEGGGGRGGGGGSLSSALSSTLSSSLTSSQSGVSKEAVEAAAAATLQAVAAGGNGNGTAGAGAGGQEG
ncbi:hypothetical protein CLOM_g1839 [Closterium sp. NIES-68]|nr:hypothetical protein CLOM_g1839 [Closterium sp. NIES-68]